MDINNGILLVSPWKYPHSSAVYFLSHLNGDEANIGITISSVYQWLYVCVRSSVRNLHQMFISFAFMNYKGFYNLCKME